MHIMLDSFVGEGGDLERMSRVFDGWNALGNTLGAAKFGIYVTQVLIGDSFMVRHSVLCYTSISALNVLCILIGLPGIHGMGSLCTCGCAPGHSASRRNKYAMVT